MLTISHRGYHARVPENTVEAFEEAVARGVDGIETDVRLTADDRIVLFHNRHVGDQLVAGLTHEALNAAVGFSVPSLESVLERWGDTLWLLEIKSVAATDPMVNLLKHLGTSRRVIVISFWHSVIERVRSQISVECGVSVSHRPISLQAAGLDRWPNIIWNFEFLEPELVREAAGRGQRNFVYGTETPAEHQQCLDMKVDGIITDFPELVPRLNRAG